MNTADRTNGYSFCDWEFDVPLGCLPQTASARCLYDVPRKSTSAAFLNTTEPETAGQFCAETFSETLFEIHFSAFT
jgi:hypothetical protein